MAVLRGVGAIHLQTGERDRLADHILEALKTAGSNGLTQTDLNKLFSGHQKAMAIHYALVELEQCELVTPDDQTGGRPVQADGLPRWKEEKRKSKEAEAAAA